MSSILHERPDATAYPIEDLVPLARKGKFRLPSLQRLFKWQGHHVRDLFDSIYRGFPIGTLLLWKRRAEAGRFYFGPPDARVEIDAKESTEALWIVDGQQRIASLVGVLSPPAAPTGVFRLYFDLAWEDTSATSEKPTTPFVSAEVTGRADPNRVLLPMNVVLDSEQLEAWLDDSGLRGGPPEYVRRARRLNKLVREYKIPAYVVETEDVQTLVLIFERVNNAGARLDKSEVFNALLASRSEGDGLPEMGKRVRDLGFGDLDPDLLLKVVLAANDGDITNLSTEQFRETLRKNPEVVGTAEAALARVIDFMRRDADIPHAALLPYTFPIIALSRFFRHHPSPKPRSRALLSRWVWRGAITGEHRAERIPTVRSVMSRLAEASRKDGEEAAVQVLMKSVPGVRPPPEPHAFRFNSAHSKLDLLALASLGPRDLVDDDEDLGPLFARPGSRTLNVGPLLAEHGTRAIVTILPDEEERTLANVLIHPPISRRLLLGALASATPEILMSHGIEAEAADALRAHDYERMIDLRGKRLASYVSSFLDAHARWGETDRPTLAWLTRHAMPGESESPDEQDARV